MKNNFDEAYLRLVERVMSTGSIRNTRAGPTRQIFGAMFTTDALLHNQFPILTSRKIYYKPVLGELAAFLRGATKLQTFKDFGCNYWDANAAAWVYNDGAPVSDHFVGNIYGTKWRNFHGVDQLKKLIHDLLQSPLSRRHVLTAYDPVEDWHCLPPCHLTTQFNIQNYKYLECIVYMRSVDLCLGLPSDIILYATLMIIISNQVGLKPGSLTFMLADTHIYENHIEQFKKQLAATTFELPSWMLNPDTTVDNFIPEHLALVNYQHGEKLEYPFAA